MQLKRNIIGVAIFILLVTLVCLGFHKLWNITHTGQKATEDIYQNLAVSVIISWIIFLIAYYMWAIQFYNINRGWTDKDWNDQEAKKKIDPSLAEEEPDKNPNNDQSLGLPTGSVRATIALSLLVAGLSMTIASFSMNNTFPTNALFVDQFEFFKTAFLMMIAFYFGAKSLEILRQPAKPAPAAPVPPAGQPQAGNQLPEDSLDSVAVKNNEIPFKNNPGVS